MARTPGKPKRTTYSEEQRAAVMAALLAGQSVSQVAAEYRIPRGTVCKWSAALADQRATAAEESRGSTKSGDIGGLLMGYVAASLRSLTAQLAVFADPDWLRSQDAGQLAVLHGVQTDKVVRLLEALGGPPEAVPDARADAPSAS